MADFSSQYSAQGAGIIAPSTPVQQPLPFDSVGAALGVVNTGLSLFSAYASDQQRVAKQQADALDAQQKADASGAAARFIHDVEQVRQLKGGTYAQTFAAQQFAELQANLEPGTRENFVKYVGEGLGWKPIEAATSELVKQENAALERQRQNKELASSIYLASVDLRDESAVNDAYVNVQNMTPEQIDFIIAANSAEDLKVQKEVNKHNLLQERYATQDAIRNQHQRVVTSQLNAGVNKLVAGYQVRMEQAIQSGDVNKILSLQKEGLRSIQEAKANLINAAVESLAEQGIRDVDTATIAGQLNTTINSLNNLESTLSLNDIQNATAGAAKWMITSSLVNTATKGTPESAIALTVLSDQQFGTNIGTNYIENNVLRNLFQDAWTFNGKDDRDLDKNNVEHLSKSAARGSVQALSELDPTTPNLATIAVESAKAQLEAIKVGSTKDTETKEALAEGIINNWQYAADGNSPIAIRSKVFEPIMIYLSDQESAKAYKEQLAGSENLFLRASSEYIRGNVVPSLSRLIGDSRDLNSIFEVQVQDGKFKLTAKEVNFAPPPEDSFTRAAVRSGGTRMQENWNYREKLTTLHRQEQARAARKTEALFNRIVTTYSNLYDIPINTAIDAFAESYARALGVSLIKPEETKTGEQ